MKTILPIICLSLCAGLASSAQAGSLDSESPDVHHSRSEYKGPVAHARPTLQLFPAPSRLLNGSEMEAERLAAASKMFKRDKAPAQSKTRLRFQFVKTN